MRAVFAVLLAFVAASLYALSTSAQALEARRTPRATALRVSILARLARRPIWLAGTAAGLVAWPVQLAALAFGSVALVQPAFGFALVVLLVLGATMLHEHVGAREIAGVAAIAGAVALLGWAAPGQTGAFRAGGPWAIGLSLVLVGPGPFLLRRLGRAGGLATSVAAGLGWAWVALATTLVDEAIADRRWVVALAWAAGVGIASWGALISEMTSLQCWPATRAIPVAFGLEMLLPAALAPLLTREPLPHVAAFGIGLAVAAAGAGLLGTSQTVGSAAAPLTAP